MSKYELAKVGNAILTVDVSMLDKDQSLFFNATDMAKPFGKIPKDFWKQTQNKKYLEALIVLSGDNYTKDNFIQTKRGKYGGTYFLKDLALQFARWLSPMFGVLLDQWTIDRLQQEHEWKQFRLESKTGFLPMTNAVLHAHDPVMPYHFRNEADMINRIVLGMSAKAFKSKYRTKNIRNFIDAIQLSEINRLQIINTGLIEIGMDYKQRKEHLRHCHERGLRSFVKPAEKDYYLELS